MGSKNNKIILLEPRNRLFFYVVNSSIIIEAINSHISDTSKKLNSNASNQEIVAAITAYWTGGTASGNITYEYHNHESGCYYTCSGTMIHSGDSDPSDDYDDCYCNRCGRFTWNADGEPCGRQYTNCGYSDGQIISATITY